LGFNVLNFQNLLNQVAAVTSLGLLHLTLPWYTAQTILMLFSAMHQTLISTSWKDFSPKCKGSLLTHRGMCQVRWYDAT